ncbi:MAG: hypothetical protein AAF657_37265, partial [Acidobacteriota bacterium]
ALAEAGRCDEAEVWQSRAVEAARQAGAEQQERAFGATLAQLKKRPCRIPGRIQPASGGE